MKPILFEFGAVTVYAYGFMLAVGFIIAAALASQQARREGYPGGKILDMSLFILIVGIIGARLLYVGMHWNEFAGDPISILFLNRGGLAVYGGLIMGIPLSILFIKKQGLPFWKTADLLSPYLALVQSIGRIGCFLNGCCYGKPAESVLGFDIVPHYLPIYPTQLYASAGLLVLFLLLRYQYGHRRFEGQIFLSYLIIYSSFRFFIEYLRGDNPVVLFGYTSFQCVSFVLFFISLAIYGMRLWKTTHLPSNTTASANGSITT